MTSRRGDWIQTWSGRQFWPLDPRVDEIAIEDIAHALGMKCRYGGHTQRFYSVAEHSVLVSINVPRKDALAGLLHDASEAYLADVPRPIKGDLVGYAEIEANMDRVIAAKFGVEYPWPASVKSIDHRLMLAEKEVLMPSGPPWTHWETDTPLDILEFACFSPPAARAYFLSMFRFLTK